VNHPCCMLCAFWEEDEDKKLGNLRKGECRLLPPVVGQRGHWPVTSAVGWCGQYKPPPQDPPEGAGEIVAWPPGGPP